MKLDTYKFEFSFELVGGHGFRAAQWSQWVMREGFTCVCVFRPSSETLGSRSIDIDGRDFAIWKINIKLISSYISSKKTKKTEVLLTTWARIRPQAII